MDIDDGVHVTDFLVMLSEKMGKDILKPTVIVALNGTKLLKSEKKLQVLKIGDNVSIFEVLV